MTFLTLILLAGLTLPGADQVIDVFDYDDNASDRVPSVVQ
jgi:hypothetical protein